ncbi:MAG: 4-diphosphocytidyl-2-C-methyl-D-erythritol kinase [Solirubrobacteraceae bacterium]|jgi:4-diphosphocytidyl-2-C-methyl-D-erythritol kinase|nr:4-diphosphocytidyl-2-C-methyl-D-erythritol kinase [Solirubrobacteraceae bacterium]
MSAALHEPAPAKLNLCLFLGPRRPSDGRHELVTVFQPLTLADTVALEPAPLGARADEVSCPGVAGAPEDNLAAAALRAFRARTGWAAPPVRLRIDKRIPVAAGLAGGSADAGAALRLAARAAEVDDDALLREIAFELGADVPAQVRPARFLATGAGEELHPLGGPAVDYAVLVLPAAEPLSTADVYRRADEIGLARDDRELGELLRAVGGAGTDLPDGLVVNDLEPAARALCPAVGEALAAVRDAGADRALVCGSGPTVAGLFRRADAARAAAVALGDRTPRPILAEPWHAPAREPVA